MMGGQDISFYNNDNSVWSHETQTHNLDDFGYGLSSINYNCTIMKPSEIDY